LTPRCQDAIWSSVILATFHAGYHPGITLWSRPMLMRCLFPLGLFLCLLPVRPALGWAELGHQLVGELAQASLAPMAQREVEYLLEGEPAPSLGGVAYWADTLRNSDPERFRATALWHYVSVGPGCRYDADAVCANGDCIVGAIDAQLRALADRSLPREQRRDALKFLVHFVGDVHQPLHAGDRDDRGGNSFQLSLRTTIPPEAYAREHFRDGIMGTNLHAVWDYYVLASAELSTAEYSHALQSRPMPPVSPSMVPADWAKESCRLIEAAGLYPAGHIMNHDYLDSMRPLAEQRVQAAAHRLAQLLNTVFSNQDGADAPTHAPTSRDSFERDEG